MSVLISSWSRVETYRKIIVVEPQSSSVVSDEGDSGFSSQHELPQSFLSSSKSINSIQNSSAAVSDIPPRRSNKSCKVSNDHDHHSLGRNYENLDFRSTVLNWFWNLDIPPSYELLRQRKDTHTIGNCLSDPATTRRTKNLSILFEKLNFNSTTPLLLQRSVSKSINVQNCFIYLVTVRCTTEMI